VICALDCEQDGEGDRRDRDELRLYGSSGTFAQSLNRGKGRESDGQRSHREQNEVKRSIKERAVKWHFEVPRVYRPVFPDW
jgi:hypothetical protein